MLIVPLPLHNSHTWEVNVGISTMVQSFYSTQIHLGMILCLNRNLSKSRSFHKSKSCCLLWVSYSMCIKMCLHIAYKQLPVRNAYIIHTYTLQHHQSPYCQRSLFNEHFPILSSQQNESLYHPYGDPLYFSTMMITMYLKLDCFYWLIKLLCF